MEGPVKGDFRLARRATTIGGVDIPAGTTVMVLNGAAGRDPDASRTRRSSASTARTPRSTSPSAADRTPARAARSPGPRPAISIERLLARLGDIRISEAAHGPAGDRRYEYAPTYILRGLQRLHLDFTPIG